MTIETKDDFDRLLEALCMELPISDEQMFSLIVAHGESVRAAVEEERARILALNGKTGTQTETSAKSEAE